MSNQLPDWKTTTAKSTTTAYEGEYSQGFPYEDFGVLPIDSAFLQPPTDNSCWNTVNITTSATAAAGGGDDHEYFQEIFQNLSNILLDPLLQMQQPTPAIFSHDKVVMLRELSLEKGEFSGKTTTSHEMETKSVVLSRQFKQSKDERLKRSRATEHNVSERMRRNKIQGKLKMLQELVPNCIKTDQASMLDDVIKYVKSLQLQVQVHNQMMSMGGGAVYQTPNLSLAGIQGTQMSQFKPYLPMGLGLGTSNAYEIGLPTMSVPSATAGLPLMSGLGVQPVNPQLQMQMPFLALLVMPGTTAATSNMVQPRFATNFPRTFSYANQAGECSSPNIASDNEKVPFINQESMVMASYVVTPTSN